MPSRGNQDGHAHGSDASKSTLAFETLTGGTGEHRTHSGGTLDQPDPRSQAGLRMAPRVEVGAAGIEPATSRV